MSETILEIKELKKSFGDNPILQGLSLEIKKGGSCYHPRGIWLWEKYPPSLPQRLRKYSRWRYSSGWSVYR